MSERILTQAEVAKLLEDKPFAVLPNQIVGELLLKAQDAKTANYYEQVMAEREQELIEEIETKGLAPFDCGYLNDCRNKQLWLPDKCFKEDCKFRDWQQLKQKRGK